VTAKDYGECESCYRAEDIAEAVAAERERCARIAAEWFDDFPGHGLETRGYGALETTEMIAAAIRKGN
jgi:hypothetical protein